MQFWGNALSKFTAVKLHIAINRPSLVLPKVAGLKGWIEPSPTVYIPMSEVKPIGAA